MLPGGVHKAMMRNGASKAGILIPIALKYVYCFSSQLSTIPKQEIEELKMELKSIFIHISFPILGTSLYLVYYFLI